MIEKSGLVVQRIRMLKMEVSQAEQFYQEHQGKHFYSRLVDFMTSGPVIGMQLQGKGAIVKWRTLLGTIHF